MSLLQTIIKSFVRGIGYTLGRDLVNGIIKALR